MHLFISDINIFHLFPPRKVHLEVQTVEVFKSLKAEHIKIGFIELTFFPKETTLTDLEMPRHSS
jgi:hypothetical protein